MEPLSLNYHRQQEVSDWITRELRPEQRRRLDRLLDLVAGFRSAYALELLSSVAYLLSQEPGSDVNGLVDRMCDWSERKEAMADHRNVLIAFEHLRAYGNSLEIA